MISRAWMLLAAALVSPAWSQEAAAVPPKVASQSFDLHSPSIQQLVRDTAATQYTLAQVVEEEPPVQKPVALEEEDSAPMERAPGSSPAPPAPRWLKVLFKAVGEVLEPEEDLELEAQYRAWNFCLANNRDKPTDQRNQACSQVAVRP